MKRHISTHKSSHEEVAAILKRPVQEQNKWFESKRIEGMYEYNLKYLDSMDEAKFMRERKTKSPDNVRMCGNCKRFFSNRTFYKHKEKCGLNSDPLKPSVQTMITHRDSEFVINILNFCGWMRWFLSFVLPEGIVGVELAMGTMTKTPVAVNDLWPVFFN